MNELNNLELPKYENTVIIHYGCGDFSKNDPKIFWIGAIKIYPNKEYFFEDNDEEQIINRLKDFINKNDEKTFVHWSMNSPKFGFNAIERRYFQLTSKKIDLKPKLELDFSEYLKLKYGPEYIEREGGRLDNLAKLNKFTGIKTKTIVDNLNEAVDRLELIFSIFQAETFGRLKVNNSQSIEYISNKNTKEYSAKENALAYILDLKAEKKEIPINKHEGGLAAKELNIVGKNRGFEKPDTFYRAVQYINKNFEINKLTLKDLKNISNNWKKAVTELSKNWEKTSKYLKDIGIPMDDHG